MTDARDRDLTPYEDDPLLRRLAATLSEAEAAVPAAPRDLVATTRSRYARGRARRNRLAVVASMLLVLVTSTVAAGGIPDELRPGIVGARPGPDVVRVWTLRSEWRGEALRRLADKFRADTGTRVEITEFANEEYKEALRRALDTPAAPDVFLNWGGGDLADLVRRHQVLDLRAAAPSRRAFAAFQPEILDAARVDGGLYGLPMSGVQPVLLFYNADVFADAGLRPPATYADLLGLVDAFVARGVTPLALAGAHGWTELMYLMYLVDRIGGSRATAAISAGRPGAWADPAVRRAAELCQALAERGAFGEGFDRMGYDAGGTSHMLATGRAAMQVMGSWEYGNQLVDNPSFVRDGRLGWVPFPAVPGAGDPASLVGVPANYFSVAAGSRRPDRAVDFLLRTLTSDTYLDGLVRGGELPAVRDAGARAAAGGDGFVAFTHRLVADAPSFALAWDQALGPATGARLNGLVQQLFEGLIGPDDLVAAMDRAALTARGVPGPVT